MKSIHRKLLRDHAVQQRRYSRLMGLWSNSWRESGFYTIMRSRGFFYRKVTRFTLYLTETIGISILANVTIAKSAWNLMLASIILALLIDSVLQGSRFLFLAKSTPVKQVVIAPLLAYLLALGSAAYAYAPEIASADEIVLLIGVSRALATLVEMIVECFTFRISLTERVFFPPFMNAVTIVAAVIAVTAGDLVSGMMGLYVIIVAHAVIRMSHSMAFFIAAMKRQAQVIAKPQGEHLSGTSATRHADITPVLVRTALILSVWVQPALIMVADFSFVSFLGFAGAWGALGLMSSVVERPYRAVLVDISRAISLRQWRFIGTQLRLATRTSLGIALGFSALVLSVTLSKATPFYVYAGTWMIMLLMGRVLISRLVLVGAEELVTAPVVSLRFVVAPLIWWAQKDSPVGLLMSFAALEAVILAWCYWLYSRTDLMTFLGFKHSSMMIGQDQKVSAVTSRDFIDVYRILGESQAAPPGSKLFLATLRNRVASDRRIEKLHQSLQRALGPAATIVSVDERRLFIWVLESVDREELLCRLAEAEPGLFANLRETSKEEVASSLRSQIDLGFPVHDVLHSTGLARAHLLDAATLLGCQGVSHGVWWVCDNSGVWRCRDGVADKETSANLHGMCRRSIKRYLWLDTKLQKIFGSDRRFWFLHPYGEVIALFEVHKHSQRLAETLKAISAALIAERLTGQESDKKIIPAEAYHLTKVLAEGIAGRTGAKLTEQVLPEQKGGDDQQREPGLACTQDGRGKLYRLQITSPNEERPTGGSRYAA